MKTSCTGVILAGGLNSRYSGRNKAFIPVRGERIMDRIYGVFQEVFEEIILVTNDPLQYLEWDLKIVTDIFPYRSSLTGIHAGLFFTTTPFAFFAACDAPFLKREIVEMVIGGIETGFDVVIPETSSGFEPLCAVYAKKCIRPIEQQIIQKDFKIERFFTNLRVKRIPEKLLRGKDPSLVSFFNVNTPDDLIRAEALYSMPDQDEGERKQTRGRC
jgi:molybdopterin-guanine dinucleotide biosynthesis protein A